MNEKHSDEVRVEHVKAHHKTKKHHGTKYVDHGTKYVDYGTKYVTEKSNQKHLKGNRVLVEDYGTRYVNGSSSSTSRYVSRSHSRSPRKYVEKPKAYHGKKKIIIDADGRKRVIK